MDSIKRDVRKIIPVVNIADNDKEIILEAEMAGLTKEEAGITVNADTLVLTGKKNDREAPQGYNLIYSERCGYEYERSFILGDEVDKTKIHAKYDNGILKVTLPKVEDIQPKKIAIE